MYFFFFKQKTAYEMRISDWSSDVCSSDLEILGAAQRVGRCEIGAQLHPWVTPPHDEEVNARNSYTGNLPADLQRAKMIALRDAIRDRFGIQPTAYRAGRSEEHTSELQSLMRSSYAVFCLKIKKKITY